MVGIVSAVLSYYGYIHLAYYSSHQFLGASTEAKGIKSGNDSTAADETATTDDRLYMWLSKW